MTDEVPDYQQEQLKKIKSVARRHGRRAWFRNLLKILVPAVLFGSYFRFEAGWLEVTKKKINVPKIPPGKKITALHLSDLHLSSLVSIQHIDRAFQKGMENAPDVCFLTGDYVTSQPTDSQLVDLRNCLLKYSQKIPIFACLGNHDGGNWSAKNGGFQTDEKIRTVLKNARVRLLDNEQVSVLIKGVTFTITGLGDLWSMQCMPQKCMTKISYPAHLLLCHNPDAKDILRDYHWDLMLAGHTHGGQFRIPFTQFAPLAPVKDLSLTQGLHSSHGKPIYITRGVGNIFGIRINCRPEVSILELASA